MSTINALIGKLKLTAVLALLTVASGGAAAHNHADVESHGVWGMVFLGYTEAEIAEKLWAHPDFFTFFLQNKQLKHKGYVKATCYEYYANNPKGMRPATWTLDVKGLDDIHHKRQPGFECRKGYLDISLDPDGPDGRAEWIFVGRLFPCTGKWVKSHVKLALVNYVSDDRRHARVLAGCKRGNHQWGIPRANWSGYQVLSNIPGEPYSQLSNTNTPPNDGRFAVHLNGNQDFFDRVQGHVKWSCYTYDPKGGKDHRHKWTKTVVALQVKRNGKTYRGERCRNGFIDVSIDPDKANGGAKRVFIGRLYECDYTRNVRFAWLSQVHDNMRHAVLRTGCFADNHFNNIKDISHRDSRLFTVGKWPNQKLPWNSNPNTPPK